MPKNLFATDHSDPHIISVVIPSIGRASTDLCKEALARQTRPPNEVIVVQDDERRGAAWARNQGVRRAHGDLIAFVDDDCLPPEDWLERLIQAIDCFDAAGAGGTYQETDPLLDAIRKRRILPKTEEIDTTGLVGTGGNVMYRRSWLDECAEDDGYVFNESFRISQDWELAWRLRLRGAKLVFIPTKVTHLRRVTQLTYLRDQFGRGIGIAMLFKSQRSANADISVHNSLVWGQTGQKKAKWFRAFWYKAVGPFDVSSFTRMRDFWLFWLGEKFQAAGFMWGLIHEGSRGVTDFLLGSRGRHRKKLDKTNVPTMNEPVEASQSPQERQEKPEDVPSFSIVLETENLATDLVDMSRYLDSLARQDLSATLAEEVLLIESGDIPPDVLEQLNVDYPWVSIHQVAPDTGYYEAKMEGARLATGEVVVFCDSDCKYEPGWLRSLLLPFCRGHDVDIVAGETSMTVTGPYSLAMLLTRSFPPFSHRTEPFETNGYAANNVAFRRNTLTRCPIRGELPIYRGNCTVHAAELRRMGHKIWKQPQARTIHPSPPKGLLGFFWRWLLSGHDMLLRYRLIGDMPSRPLRVKACRYDLTAVLRILYDGSLKPLRRLPAALREDHRRAVFLPIAAVVILASTFLFLSGLIVSWFNPNFLLARGVAKLEMISTANGNRQNSLQPPVGSGPKS